MRRVTIQEAASILKVSDRTIERRIKAGALDGEKEGAHRYVWLDGEELSDPVSDVDGHLPTVVRQEPTEADMLRLVIENQMLREERDWLRQQLLAPKLLAPPRDSLWRRVRDFFH